jgi:hypothetical protein
MRKTVERERMIPGSTGRVRSIVAWTGLPWPTPWPPFTIDGDSDLKVKVK